MQLHEIELYRPDPAQALTLAGILSGWQLAVDAPSLKVFTQAQQQIDLNFSSHYPAQPVSLSFLVQDVEDLYHTLTQKGFTVQPPAASHRGYRAIYLELAGLRLAFHQPSPSSTQQA